MPESLPEYLVVFREEFQDFLNQCESLDGHARLDLSTKQGFYKMGQPREFGGEDASLLKMVIAWESMAVAGLSSDGTILGPQPGVLGRATGMLRKEYLLPFLNGEKFGSFAFTESDRSSPTKATSSKNVFKINGNKSYVSGLEKSDFISVLADVSCRDEGDNCGPTLFVVDKGSNGVIIEELFTSIDGSNHGRVNFVDVEVPTQNIVGEIGKGIPAAIDRILRERLEQAAVASGMAIRATKLLETHLSEINGAGKRMGDIEGIRLRYADMRIKTYAIRSVLYRTSNMIDESNDFINEITMAKVFCTETASEVIDWALQIFGGRSLIKGHPLEEMYRRIRSMRLAGGASDVLRLNVSRGVFDFQSGTL